MTPLYEKWLNLYIFGSFLKKSISAVTVAALFLTALPVEGLGAIAYAANDTTDVKEPDMMIRLQPNQASTFHDTDGDGLGEFEGWGTSLCWWANRLGYSRAMTSQAASVFFSDQGLNLNIGRYNVGGGDDVGETAKVSVNEKANFYDLETEGYKPTYEGSNMSVDTVESLATAAYTVTASETGSYTVKLLLTLSGTNNRDVAIQINGEDSG